MASGTSIDPVPDADADPIFVDDLEPELALVGYGGLGRHGSLGYEEGRVVVGGRAYDAALSTHPPAHLRFRLPPGCTRFRCQVALNDDVAANGSWAAFTVVADGRVAAEAPLVRAGDAPVALVADVRGASTLDMTVSSMAWAYCHAVWLEPTFETGAGGDLPSVYTDPLGRADIVLPAGLPAAERCIVTTASAGFETWLDDLLSSVRVNGGCPDAMLVVLALGGGEALEAVAASHGAAVVRCRPRAALDPNIKAVMYAAGHVIPAARFVLLDADMLVLSDLGPLFATIDACPPNALLVCGEGNDHGIPDLATALDAMYGGGDDPPFFRRDSAIGRNRLVVNDGLLAGSRAALCALDAELRSMPGLVGWIDGSDVVRWRNQFAANVALARLGSAVELDPTWNLQLHVQDVDVDGTQVRWRGRPVRVLHFSGWGKYKLPELRDATRASRAARLEACAEADAEPVPSPAEAALDALCAEGRFEEAMTFGRELCAAGPLSARAAERLTALEASMAPPAVGSEVPSQRSWTTDLPREVLLAIQQAVHHQTYRGRQLVKNPFDLAMYHQLFERVRPATIVEVGSKDGGSALFLAGLAAGLGLDTHVHSYDLHRVDDVEHPDVTFHVGDGRHLGGAITESTLESWPRPLVVIDDADHEEPTTTAILEFVHPHLRPGDHVVVEDGNLSDLYPDLYPEHSSGPHRALRRFIIDHGDDYAVVPELCDLFGYNTTTASNGILRRRGRREQAPSPLTSRPWLAADVPVAALEVPTMLSFRERQLLHWLAREHVTGVGRIVDGGSFLGGSTAALASGLAARDDGPWDQTIAAYDLFRVEDYTLASFATCVPDPTVGASFRSAFDASIAQWARHVEVREGDAVAWGWSGEPIEVLFLDMVKTWDLNDLVLEKLLPFLIPGHSVIVQQDYLWGYGPWIHMTMELLEPSVTILDAMPNGSVAYLLTAPIPSHLVGARLRETLSPQRQRGLMDRAVARWQGEERGLVELARAMLVAEQQGPGAGRAELEATLARHHDQPRVDACAAILRGYLP